jgi:hypothetical protein
MGNIYYFGPIILRIYELRNSNLSYGEALQQAAD